MRTFRFQIQFVLYVLSALRIIPLLQFLAFFVFLISIQVIPATVLNIRYYKALY